MTSDTSDGTRIVRKGKAVMSPPSGILCTSALTKNYRDSIHPKVRKRQARFKSCMQTKVFSAFMIARFNRNSTARGTKAHHIVLSMLDSLHVLPKSKLSTQEFRVVMMTVYGISLNLIPFYHPPITSLSTTTRKK